MKKIEFFGTDDQLGYALDFVEKELKSSKFNRRIANEAMLLYEEMMVDVLRYVPQDQLIEVRFVNNLGKYTIKITFPGEEYSIHNADSHLSKMILQYFDDRLNLRYINGLNTLTIGVKESNHRGTLLSTVAVALAAVTYLILNSTVSDLSSFAGGVIEPICHTFFNLFLLLSAPVTLVSVVANFIRCSTVADRKISVGKVLAQFFSTSVAAIIIGYVSYAILSPFINEGHINFLEPGQEVMKFEFVDIMDSMIPDNIIDIFKSSSPLPVIFFAFMIGIAFCSMQRGRNKIKSAVFGIQDFLDKVLGIAFKILPIGVYFAVLYKLIDNSRISLVIILNMAEYLLLATVLILAFYSVLLLVNKIRPIDFVREYKDIIKEDFKIGSTVDSINYNIRAFGTRLDTPKEHLAYVTQLGAYINLDGTVLTLFLATLSSIGTEERLSSPSVFIFTAVIAFILSMGAPAQYGSIIIGFVILNQILGTWEADTMYWAIIMEAFLGRLATQINIVGGVVTTVIDSKNYDKQRNKVK